MRALWLWLREITGMKEPTPKRRLSMPDECPKCYGAVVQFEYDGGGRCCSVHGVFYNDFRQWIADETAMPEQPDTEW